MERKAFIAIIDKVINQVKAEAFEDATGVLSDLSMDLQFDIANWMVESEEDEKLIQFYQETLESIELAQFILDSLFDTDEEDYDEEDCDEENFCEEDNDTQTVRIINILSSIKDDWMK